MGPTPPRPLSTNTALTSLAVALAYFLTGRLGLMLPAFGENVTLLWMPSGIATAVLLRHGTRVWPGIWLGAFAVDLATGLAWSVSLAISVCGTIGPLFTAWLLDWLGFRKEFDRMRDFVLLAICGAVGMGLTATGGALSLSFGNALPAGGFGRAWLSWWAGDAMGVIAATPLILTLTANQLRLVRRHLAEFLALVVLTLLVSWSVFVVLPTVDENAMALGFLPLPFVAWAALRFGPAGTSTALLLLWTATIYGAATHQGPLQQVETYHQLTVLWTYMVTTAVLGWLITGLATARVRAVDARQLFDQALTELSVGLLLCRPDRRITYANEGFTRLTGYTGEEVTDLNCALLHGRDTDPATVARLGAALEERRILDCEILSYRKDGSAFWNALTVSPVRDDRGAFNGYLAIQRDVTMPREAAARLEESLATLRLLINSVPAFISIVDPEERYEMVNQRYEEFFARPASEIVGRKVSDIQPPAAYEEIRPHLVKALAGETVHYEAQSLSPDGKRHCFDIRYVPRRAPDGRVTGIFVLTFDVTDTHEAALALEENRRHVDAIFSNLAEVVFSTTPKADKPLFVSPSAERLYGRSAEEFYQNPQLWREVVVPEDLPLVDNALGQLFTDGACEFEYRIVRPDGTLRTVRSRATIIRDEKGEPVRIDGIVLDITRRREAEQALRESEARYRQLFDANPNPMWAYDLETLKFLAVNAAAIEHYGYTREEFLAMTARDIRPKEDIPAFLQEVAKVSQGTGRAGAWRHYKRDGTLVIAEVKTHVIELGGRRAEVVLVHDVTERRRAELRATGEREVLELLTTGAPLWQVLDRLARSYEELFPGMLCSILLVGPAGNTLHHGAAPSLPREYLDAINGAPVGPMSGSCGTAVYSGELVLVPDIRTDARWEAYRDIAEKHGLLSCWSVPIISSNGKKLGAFALYYRLPATPAETDIAEVKRGAQFAAVAIDRHELLRSLKASQSQLEALMGNLPGMAYRCQNDAQRTMTYVSDYCEKITGYRRDEIEGSRVVAYADLIHAEDRDWLAVQWDAMREARASRHNEYRILDRHGAERWVSDRATCVCSEDARLLYIDGFVQDITAARQAKIEREQLDRKMLETQKLESLGVLAGGIAHDFNNLLTSILGNASIAAVELPHGSPVQDCIEQITEASLRAADLCKQMLAYSGRGRFVVQKLNLGQLVEQTAQMLQISISKMASLRFHLEKGLPLVEVDATQIRQVIMNLVINASEAIGDRSGVISLSTGLTRVDRAYLSDTLMDPELPEGDYVYLEVSDTGSGMSAETRARIFDPFFTTKFTGRGLGLAAVLGIVRGHRGALKVYSEVGRGTTFKLLFPAAEGSAEPVPETTAPPLEWHGHGTVLVVDDEETMRSTIARMMRKLGLDVVLTTDGREAIEIFRRTPELFGAVLLDLTMPNLDGEQTFAELRRIRPNVRVVLMSGFNAQEALVRFNGKGLANFLQKPFAINALRSVLQEIMGDASPADGSV